MGCQICGCNYIYDHNDELHTKCFNCCWINDPDLKTLEDYSKINKMTGIEYRKILEKYPQIKEFIKGYKLVTTIHPDSIPLAYHHDLQGQQGCWGVVDENWNEIIKPKYLFPLMKYNNGVYMACKGTGWIKDKEWDNDQTFKEGKGRYWSKEEKWGLINFEEKEIIPCIYDEILCIDNDWFEETHTNLFSVYRHQYTPYNIQEVAIFDGNGKEIIPFKYNDVFWYENEGQIIIYKDGTRYNDEGKVGVYDLKLNREIIKPKYNSMDYIDYNLFLISEDRENGFKATIINEKEEIIGKEKIWNFIVTTGNDDRKYKGKTVDDKRYYFNIKDNQIVDMIEVDENIK